MQTSQKPKPVQSSVVVTGRRKIEITGVTDVMDFSENGAALECGGETLTVEGRGLRVTVLSVEDGRFSAEGEIISLYYADGDGAKGGGFISRMFGKRS